MKLTLWVETEPGTVMKDLEFFIRGMSASFTIKIDEETDEVYGHVNRLERGDVEVVTEDSSVDGTLLELLPSAAEIKAMVSGDLSALPDEPLDILEEDAPSVARAKKIFHNGRDGHKLGGGRPVH